VGSEEYINIISTCYISGGSGPWDFMWHRGGGMKILGEQNKK